MRFLILFLLLTTNIFAKNRDSVFVRLNTYEVMYSEKLEQPLWVAYNVRCPYGSYPRTGMDFYINDSIHTSDNRDYINNIFDKGHLAPAADFNCDRETLLSTFSYLNCALQNQYLNRGVWKSLEEYERELAKKYPIVEIKVFCKFSQKSVKLKSGATVPDGFYKIIKYQNTTLTFYFPNQTPKFTDYMKYLVK
jgi:endonuclease G, mitochondrial